MAASKIPDLSGTTIGEYEIVTRLGVGGMGVVYEGKHPVIGKRVAVKVLLPQLSYDQDLVDRFVAEARAVNEIGHRGIVDIFSFGVLATGEHYFVMEFLNGTPFDRILKTRAPIPPEEVLWWAEEIAEALQAAHEAGIIHRDIKPSNLFLVDSGRGRPYVKLLDFGIAKLGAREGESTPQTRASMVVGTPDYMSPEQARGKPITAATDVYALGCVMFELLTGKRPFKGENALETMFMHVENPAPPVRDLQPGLSVEIENLLLWTMEKDPGARPATADALREQIVALRKSLPEVVLTPRPSPARGSLPGLSPSGRMLPIAATPRPPTTGPRRSVSAANMPVVKIGENVVAGGETQAIPRPVVEAAAIPVELSFTGEHVPVKQAVPLGEAPAAAPLAGLAQEMAATQSAVQRAAAMRAAEAARAEAAAQEAEAARVAAEAVEAAAAAEAAATAPAPEPEAPAPVEVPVPIAEAVTRPVARPKPVVAMPPDDDEDDGLDEYGNPRKRSPMVYVAIGVGVLALVGFLALRKGGKAPPPPKDPVVEVPVVKAPPPAPTPEELTAHLAAIEKKIVEREKVNKVKSVFRPSLQQAQIDVKEAADEDARRTVGKFLDRLDGLLDAK